MLSSKVLAGFVWSLLNVVGTMAIGLVTAMIAARSLGSANYGQYGYLVWLGAAGGQIATLGLARPVHRFIASTTREGQLGQARRLLRTTLLVAGVATPVVSAIAVVLARVHGQATLLAAASVVVLVVCTTATSLATVTLQAMLRFREVTRASVAGSLVVLFASGYVALTHGTWVAQVAAVALGSVVSVSILVRGVRRALREIAGDERARAALDDELRTSFRRYWLYSAVLMGIELIVWQRCEIMFLNRYSTDVAVGHYNAAVSLSSRLQALTFSLGPVIQSTISRMRLVEEREEIRDAFARFTKYSALLAAPLFMLPAAAAKPLLTLLLGASYEGAAPAFMVLVLGCLVPAITLAGSAVLYATDRVDFAVRSGAAAVVVTLLTNWLCVPRLASVGAALGNISGQIFAVTVTYAFALRPAGFRFPVRAVGPVLLAGAIGAAATRLVTDLFPARVVSLPAMVLGGLTYLACLAVVRPLDQADGAFLGPIRGRIPAFGQGLFDAIVGRLTHVARVT